MNAMNAEQLLSILSDNAVSIYEYGRYLWGYCNSVTPSYKWKKTKLQFLKKGEEGHTAPC